MNLGAEGLPRLMVIPGIWIIGIILVLTEIEIIVAIPGIVYLVFLKINST